MGTIDAQDKQRQIDMPGGHDRGTLTVTAGLE